MKLDLTSGLEPELEPPIISNVCLIDSSLPHYPFAVFGKDQESLDMSLHRVSIPYDDDPSNSRVDPPVARLKERPMLFCSCDSPRPDGPDIGGFHDDLILGPRSP